MSSAPKEAKDEGGPGGKAKPGAKIVTIDTPTGQRADDEHVVMPVRRRSSRMPNFRTTTYIETLIHLLKGNIGSGIMAMGYAFAKAGLILGPILTLLLAIVCIHAQHLLVMAAIEIKVREGREHTPNFANTVEAAFLSGPPRLQKYALYLKRYVYFSMCVTQLGFCCVYFVFVATSMLKIFGFFNPSYANPALYVECMSFLLVPVMLTCWIRDLKYLVPFSFVANLVMIFGITATLYLMSSDMNWATNFAERDYVASYYEIPLFLGTTVYSFEGISLVLPLQRQMKEERYFGNAYGVLNVGMSIVTALLILMGFVGYLRYGDNAKGSLTLNLPQNDLLPLFVNISIATGVLFTFALQMHVPVLIVWPAIKERWGPLDHPLLFEMVVRTFLVLATFAAAAVVPHMELVIALVGAVSSTSLALLLPSMLEVVLYWESGISKLVIAKDVFIFSIGIFAFITGTGMSCFEIYNALTTDDGPNLLKV